LDGPDPVIAVVKLPSVHVSKEPGATTAPRAIAFAKAVGLVQLVIVTRTVQMVVPVTDPVNVMEHVNVMLNIWEARTALVSVIRVHINHLLYVYLRQVKPLFPMRAKTHWIHQIDTTVALAHATAYQDGRGAFVIALQHAPTSVQIVEHVNVVFVIARSAGGNRLTVVVKISLIRMKIVQERSTTALPEYAMPFAKAALATLHVMKVQTH
jgi:hypothetical protein